MVSEESIAKDRRLCARRAKPGFGAVVQIARMDQMGEVKLVFGLLHGKYGLPDRGRSLTFEQQSIQGELIFVDTAEQFYRFEVLDHTYGVIDICPPSTERTTF
jgi:hypothetical protein